jgi:hypothetical protein
VFPVYIPSKGRAEIATTPGVLDELGVSYRIVVEEQERDAYAQAFGAERLLVLDPTYRETYETLDDLGSAKSYGSGPARNFAWEHSIGEGHEWHWIMDDNIRLFARYHRNRRVRVGDATIFAAMEDFVLRYTNIGMAGPHYWMFQPSRAGRRTPFTIGTRIYSCNFIRNDLRFRWRGRYNEDTILSLDLLTAGWQTVLFNAFLQWKTPTGQMPGGNTDELYQDGTYEKSRMLALAYPQYARVVRRYGRWHHYVDYSRWRKGPLIRREDYQPPATNPYATSREVPYRMSST